MEHAELLVMTVMDAKIEARPIGSQKDQLVDLRGRCRMTMTYKDRPCLEGVEGVVGHSRGDAVVGEDCRHLLALNLLL